MEKQYYQYEKDQQTYKAVLEAYNHFYDTTPKRLQKSNKKGTSKKDLLYKQLADDIVSLLGKNGYRDSRLWEYLHLDDSERRTFNKKRIEYIDDLIVFYTDNSYSPSMEIYERVGSEIIRKDENEEQEENEDTGSTFDQSKEKNVTTIVGTTTVNEAFYQKIKQGTPFTKPQFYTAKSYDDCQWYGIVMDYDVRRKETDTIKNMVLSSLDFQDAYYKISCIVYGDGGSGKSTLLRKVAIELRNSFFRVLWVNNTEFKKFYKEGLKIIKQLHTITFLVILEDWYRLTNDEKNNAKVFLYETTKITNIRIVIGDRSIQGEDYLRYLEGNNKIPLDNKDNKEIIQEIIKKYPLWRATANKVLVNDTTYQSTLFLILFVIARTHEKEIDNNINFGQTERAFVNIIAHDIKKIFNEYPGLAKMIVYSACIYSQYRINISYSCFLQLADHLNGSNVSNLFFNFNDGDSPSHGRLRIYFNVSDLMKKGERLSQDNFLFFNHDTLADFGLSFLGDMHKDLIYNDITKKTVCKLLLKVKGDDYSTSVLLSMMYKHEQQVFTDSIEMLSFAKKMVKKGNVQNRYLNVLPPFLDFNSKELKKFMNFLSKKNVFPKVLWGHYLKKNPSEASTILQHPFRKNIPSDLLTIALKSSI